MANFALFGHSRPFCSALACFDVAFLRQLLVKKSKKVEHIFVQYHVFRPLQPRKKLFFEPKTSFSTNLAPPIWLETHGFDVKSRSKKTRDKSEDKNCLKRCSFASQTQRYYFELNMTTKRIKNCTQTLRLCLDSEPLFGFTVQTVQGKDLRSIQNWQAKFYNVQGNHANCSPAQIGSEGARPLTK